ncbi:glycoside hydrolase family 3 N-terminal domain-containing protein [Micropruina sp.]|uniref:glycoside hydrolase family 3 N-terminal domain-containing protein n=1 Tax=Micropruina sp. TaxID=2737536 RepID=UPI0039E34A17
MTDLPYRNPALPVAERVEDLLSRLSLAEKAGQVTQYFYFGGSDDELDAADAPPTVDQIVAAGGAGSLLFVREVATTNELQRLAVQSSRHGIPLIFGFDVIHGFRTIFPVPIAQAASWDPALIEAGERVAAREARAVGIHWSFAPMIDISRDPRWGRIIESAGEDPTLAMAVAAAHVRGFQGDLGPENVLAGPKHLAGYGAARGGRDYEDSEISDSELWNVYLPPFRAAVEAGAANIMSAYMDLNGVPASGNKWLLTDVLRDTFGFTGFVVSDANAVRSLHTQHFARDLTDAAARAMNAGLDLEMVMRDPAYAHLPEAVELGLVSEATVDEAVRRVLTAKFALGIFDNPYADEAAVDAVLNDPAHRDQARVAAERTAVLLKNDGGALPLPADATRIAVIGQLAASQRDTLGPWVFDYDVSETVTILDGIRARAGAGAQVSYAAGVGIPERRYQSMFDTMDSVVERTAPDHDDEAALAAAVEAASNADVAVVVIGQRQNQIGEKASSDTLDLPGRQLEQLQAVVATGTPTVAVLMSGRPLDLRWADENVPAILQVWYPGTRGGDAVAALLFGDVSPGGKLPVTWPRHVGQVPVIHAHYRTFQPAEAGQRYWAEPSTPLYPFGHGLSYASFSYDNLRLSADSVALGGTVQVSVEVTNTSGVDADEVAQLYIHQRWGLSSRPLRELKGFERVTIAAGATTTISFDLGPDQLRYWSAVNRDWVQDATEIEIYVGGDSTAELSTVLTVG